MGVASRKGRYAQGAKNWRIVDNSNEEEEHHAKLLGKSLLLHCACFTENKQGNGHKKKTKERIVLRDSGANICCRFIGSNK